MRYIIQIKKMIFEIFSKENALKINDALIFTSVSEPSW